jgi:glycosyltransferase involved in cell wall biosynthesis
MGRHSGVVFSFGYHRWSDPLAAGVRFSNHRMAEQLVDDPSVEELVVVDAYRSRLARLRRGRGDWDAGFETTTSRRLLHPERWRRLDGPHMMPTIRAYRALDRWLEARSAAFRAPVLITCHPVHAAVADRRYWSDVVYYGWDDWRSYPPFAGARSLFDWAYREMARLDTNVIGVTTAIVERIGSTRGSVVPNAVSAAEFDRLPPVPGWFGELPGRVAFYAGSLDDRIDLPGVFRAAQDLPEWTFCIVGPVQLPGLLTGLRPPPNVVVRPPVGRLEVLAMAQASSVCLIPHRRTEMTEAMSPLKLYEYLGAGRAVVASDLEPMRGAGDRVVLVEPGGPLAPAIKRAAALDPLGEAELHRWRAANDWSARYAAFRSAALSGSPVHGPIGR